MRKTVKVYKLELTYNITAYERELNEDGTAGYDRYTNENLRIQDTFDLSGAMALTEVLRTIDQVHEVVKANVIDG